MSFPFDPAEPHVLVQAQLWGPAGDTIVALALDTGATGTVVSRDVVEAVGFDLTLVQDQAQITTASGVETVPRVALRRFRSLGQERMGFPVLCHTLPPGIALDGLLGLDFLRGHRLLIDFHTGQIELD